MSASYLVGRRCWDSRLIMSIDGVRGFLVRRRRALLWYCRRHSIHNLAAPKPEQRMDSESSASRTDPLIVWRNLDAVSPPEHTTFDSIVGACHCVRYRRPSDDAEVVFDQNDCVRAFNGYVQWSSTAAAPDAVRASIDAGALHASDVGAVCAYTEYAPLRHLVEFLSERNLYPTWLRPLLRAVLSGLRRLPAEFRVEVDSAAPMFHGRRGVLAMPRDGLRHAHGAGTPLVYVLPWLAAFTANEQEKRLWANEDGPRTLLEVSGLRGYRSLLHADVVWVEPGTCVAISSCESTLVPDLLHVKGAHEPHGAGPGLLSFSPPASPERSLRNARAASLVESLYIIAPARVQIDFGRVLGRGGRGTVYAGRLDGAFDVAAKCLETRDADTAHALREASVMQEMAKAAPGIVRCYGVTTAVDRSGASRTFIIMERCLCSAAGRSAPRWPVAVHRVPAYAHRVQRRAATSQP